MSSIENCPCVQVEDLKLSPQCKYKVLEILGEGGFGTVAKAYNRFTEQLVALKILKKDEDSDYYFQKEIQMLGLIEELDPDIFNIVRFIEHFESNGCQCMAFEMLDKSVDDLMNQEYSFSLNEVRPMAKQLLTALVGLQSVGVLHTDIKPDNIMLVDHEKQPFKVKLIDFGLAGHITKVRRGKMMQPIGYRAPEVMLGLPLSEAMDVWGLACCLIKWHLGWRAFGCLSEYDYMSMIVDILGIPSDELLSNGLYSHKYFVQEGSKWRLKTLQEYKDTTGDDPKMYTGRESATLEELMMDLMEFESASKSSDKAAFYDLLKKMCEINPQKRISPVEALLHPFITMDHLPSGNCYTQVAQQYMSVAETDFEPLQREGLECIAQMFREKEAAKRSARIKATPASNPAAPQNVTPQSCDINKSETSTSSSDVTESSTSSGHLSTDEDTEDMELSDEAENARCQEKCVGEITNGSHDISCDLPTTEEKANKELVQETLSRSQEEDDNNKVTVLPDMAVEPSHAASTFDGAHSTFVEELLEVDDIQPFEEDTDLEELASALEAMKEELPIDCSEILEDIEKLFQDGAATETEVKGKPSKSLLDRLRALFPRLLKFLKPKPKKPFFSKPKWIKRLPIFTRQPTMSALFRQ